MSGMGRQRWDDDASLLADLPAAMRDIVPLAGRVAEHAIGVELQIDRTAAARLVTGGLRP